MDERVQATQRASWALLRQKLNVHSFQDFESLPIERYQHLLTSDECALLERIYLFLRYWRSVGVISCREFLFSQNLFSIDDVAHAWGSIYSSPEIASDYTRLNDLCATCQPSASSGRSMTYTDFAYPVGSKLESPVYGTSKESDDVRSSFIAPKVPTSIQKANSMNDVYSNVKPGVSLESMSSTYKSHGDMNQLLPGRNQPIPLQTRINLSTHIMHPSPAQQYARSSEYSPFMDPSIPGYTTQNPLPETCTFQQPFLYSAEAVFSILQRSLDITTLRDIESRTTAEQIIARQGDSANISKSRSISILIHVAPSNTCSIFPIICGTISSLNFFGNPIHPVVDSTQSNIFHHACDVLAYEEGFRNFVVCLICCAQTGNYIECKAIQIQSNQIFVAFDFSGNEPSAMTSSFQESRANTCFFNLTHFVFFSTSKSYRDTFKSNETQLSANFDEFTRDMQFCKISFSKNDLNSIFYAFVNILEMVVPQRVYYSLLKIMGAEILSNTTSFFSHSTRIVDAISSFCNICEHIGANLNTKPNTVSFDGVCSDLLALVKDIICTCDCNIIPPILAFNKLVSQLLKGDLITIRQRIPLDPTSITSKSPQILNEIHQSSQRAFITLDQIDFASFPLSIGFVYASLVNIDVSSRTLAKLTNSQSPKSSPSYAPNKLVLEDKNEPSLPTESMVKSSSSRIADGDSFVDKRVEYIIDDIIEGLCAVLIRSQRPDHLTLVKKNVIHGSASSISIEIMSQIFQKLGKTPIFYEWILKILKSDTSLVRSSVIQFWLDNQGIQTWSMASFWLDVLFPSRKFSGYLRPIENFMLGSYSSDQEKLVADYSLFFAGCSAIYSSFRSKEIHSIVERIFKSFLEVQNTMHIIKQVSMHYKAFESLVPFQTIFYHIINDRLTKMDFKIWKDVFSNLGSINPVNTKIIRNYIEYISLPKNVSEFMKFFDFWSQFYQYLYGWKTVPSDLEASFKSIQKLITSIKHQFQTSSFTFKETRNLQQYRENIESFFGRNALLDYQDTCKKFSAIHIQRDQALMFYKKMILPLGHAVIISILNPAIHYLECNWDSLTVNEAISRIPFKPLHDSPLFKINFQENQTLMNLWLAHHNFVKYHPEISGALQVTKNMDSVNSFLINFYTVPFLTLVEDFYHKAHALSMDADNFFHIVNAPMIYEDMNQIHTHLNPYFVVKYPGFNPGDLDYAKHYHTFLKAFPIFTNMLRALKMGDSASKNTELVRVSKVLLIFTELSVKEKSLNYGKNPLALLMTVSKLKMSTIQENWSYVMTKISNIDPLFESMIAFMSEEYVEYLASISTQDVSEFSDRIDKCSLQYRSDHQQRLLRDLRITIQTVLPIIKTQNRPESLHHDFVDILVKTKINESIINSLSHLAKGLQEIKDMMTGSTKTPFVIAMEKLSELQSGCEFRLSVSSNRVALECIAIKTNMTYSTNDLVVLRDHLTLVSSSQTISRRELLKPIEYFVNDLSKTLELYDLFIQFVNMGHPLMEGTIDIRIGYPIDKTKILQYIEIYEAEKRNIQTTIRKCREKYPMTNFFTDRQLMLFVGLQYPIYLPKTQEFFSLIKMLFPSKKTQDILEIASLVMQTGKPNSVPEMIEQLSHSIEKLQTYMEDPMDYLSLPPNQLDFHLLRHDQPNFILIKDFNSIWSTCMSLYYFVLKRPPLCSEVFICYNDTSLDRIDLLLHHYLSPTSFGNRIYTIIFPENLPLKIQQEVYVKSTSNPSVNKILVFISHQEKIPQLCHYFQKLFRNIQKPTYDRDSLLLLNKDVCQQKKLDLRLLYTNEPGKGKTKLVRDWARKMETSLNPIYIHGDESLKTIAATTKLAFQQSSKLLYFSIGSTEVEKIDSFLFNLIMFGIIDDDSEIPFVVDASCVVVIEHANMVFGKEFQGYGIISLFPMISLNDSLDTSLDDSDFIFQHGTGTALNIYTYVSDMLMEINQLEQYKYRHSQRFTRTERGFPNIICQELLNWFSPDIPTLRAVFVKLCSNQYALIKSCSLLNENPSYEITKLRQHILFFVYSLARDISSISFDRNSFSVPLEKDDAMVKYMEITKKWSRPDYPVILFDRSNPSQFMLITHSQISSIGPSQETCQRLGIDYECLDTLEEFAISKIMSYSFGVNIEIVTDYLARNQDYIITNSNLLKILMIGYRMTAGLPIVLMGETGCGKTRLITFICGLIGGRLKKVDIHEIALQIPKTTVVVFFDEINTTNCMSLFKEIICERSCDGIALAKNIQIVAACNPYRFRNRDSELKTAGLMFDYGKSASVHLSQDIIYKLVYIVHPLPPSLALHVWDFGSLSYEDEEKYAQSILFDKNSSDLRNRIFPHLVAKSHNFFRELFNDTSCVSLRDIERCNTVYRWFETQSHLQYLYSGVSPSETRVKLLQYRPLVLALCVNYYYRLEPPHRDIYVKFIAAEAKIVHNRSISTKELLESDVYAILKHEKSMYVSDLDIPRATSRNSSLLENLLLLVISIYTKIPLLIIGKPGSSKSYSIQIIKNSLSVNKVKRGIFQEMPSLVFIPYQCSPLSTSEAIMEAYVRAQANEAPTLLPVLLLDEIGLAEHSPFMPLKTLHWILEKPTISVVGISNWELDASKKNRMLVLNRKEPTIEDLYQTGLDICGLYSLQSSEKHIFVKKTAEIYIKIYSTLQPSLASVKKGKSGKEYTSSQKFDFYGLRDFYGIMRYLQSSTIPIHQDTQLLYVFYRNFGKHICPIVSEFIHDFMTSIGISNITIPSVVNLIQDNLSDYGSRHLMVITKMSFGIRYLIDNLIQMNSYKILYSVSYSEYSTNKFTDRTMHIIRDCMESGKLLILVRQSQIYETLYDLLNQNYVKISGYNWCYLPIGGQTDDLYLVHKNFKCVVITSIEEAYENPPKGLAPPFLNRFEKQLLLEEHIVSPRALKEANFIKEWFYESLKKIEWTPDEAVAGYHDDIFSSIATLCDDKQTNDAALKRDIVHQILWISKPEWILSFSSSMALEGIQLHKAYFEEQSHEDLFQYINYYMEKTTDEMEDQPAQGMRLIAWTHTIEVRLQNLCDLLKKSFSAESHFCDLGLQTEESTVIASVESFKSSPKRSFLVVLCHASYCTPDRLDHFQYYIAQDEYLLTAHEKHIIVINSSNRKIQIGRQRSSGSAKSSSIDSKFTNTYEKIWKHIYLDSILPAKVDKIPNIDHLLFRTLSQALSDRSVVDIDKEIETNYLYALPFSFRISATPAKQISRFKELFQTQKDFRKLFSRRVVQMIETRQENLNEKSLWKSSDSNNMKLLEKHQTLRNALFSKIIDQLVVELSTLIDIIYCHENLLILNPSYNNIEEEALYHTWIQFLSHDPIWRPDPSAYKKTNYVTSLPRRHLFVGSSIQFPFSLVIIEVLESYFVDLAPSLDSQESINKTIMTLEALTRTTFPFLFTKLIDESGVLYSKYVPDMVSMMNIYSSHEFHETKMCAHSVLVELVNRYIRDAKFRGYPPSAHVAYWILRKEIYDISLVISQIQPHDCITLAKYLQNSPAGQLDIFLSYLIQFVAERLLTYSKTYEQTCEQLERLWSFLRKLKTSTPIGEKIEYTHGSERHMVNDPCIRKSRLFINLLFIKNRAYQYFKALDGHSSLINDLLDSIKQTYSRSSNIDTEEFWRLIVSFVNHVSEPEKSNIGSKGKVPGLFSMIEFFVRDVIVEYVIKNENVANIMDADIVPIIMHGKCNELDVPFVFSPATRYYMLRKIILQTNATWIYSSLRQLFTKRINLLNGSSTALTLYTEIFQDYGFIHHSDSIRQLDDLHFSLNSMKDSGFSTSYEYIGSLKSAVDCLSKLMTDEYQSKRVISHTHLEKLLLIFKLSESNCIRPLFKYFAKRVYSYLGSHFARIYCHTLLQTPIIHEVLSKYVTNVLPTPRMSSPSSVSRFYINSSSCKEIYETIYNWIQKAFTGIMEPIEPLLQQSNEQSQFIRAFCIALHDWVYLRYTTEPGTKDHPAIDHFVSVIDKFPCIPKGKEFLRRIVCNNFGNPELNAQLDLSHRIGYMVGVMTHAVAYVISSKPSDNPFYEIFKDPNEASKYFWPTMPDDPRKKEARKLMNTRHGVYISPNGCLYPVWNCTWPMEVVLCQECGKENIGGVNHIPLTGHVRVVEDGFTERLPYPCDRIFYSDITQKAPKGYEVPQSCMDRNEYTERNIPTVAFRILRIILHSILMVSSWESELRVPGPLPSQEVYEKYGKDWDVLKNILQKSDEDAFILVNFALSEFKGKSGLNFVALETFQSRNQYESHLMDVVLSEISKNSHQFIENAKIKDDFFDIEMQDKIAPNDQYWKKYAPSELPNLFRHRRGFGMDSIHSFLSSQSGSLSKYHTLSCIMENERKLKALRHLPSLIKWMKLIYNMYDKTITREEARSITMKDFVNRTGGTDPPAYVQTVFLEFCTCWNYIRPFAEEQLQKENGSMRIPEMNENVSIIYALSNQLAEGRIPIFVVRALVSHQNNILTNLVLPKIPSRTWALNAQLDFLTPSDVIDIDFDPSSASAKKLHDLFLRCVSMSFDYGKGFEWEVDYSELDQNIFNCFLVGKPFIGDDEIHSSCMHSFKFSNESQVMDTMTVVCSKIPQTSLPQALMESAEFVAMKHDIPAAVSHLKLLEFGLNWLKLTGGAPETILSRYLVDALMQSQVPSYFEKIRLSHVESLHHFLAAIVASDEEAKVAPVYRHPLSPALRQELHNYLSQLTPEKLEELGNELRGFVEDYLDTESYEPSRNLSVFIGPLVPWTENEYPFPEIPLSFVWDATKYVLSFEDTAK